MSHFQLSCLCLLSLKWFIFSGGRHFISNTHFYLISICVWFGSLIWLFYLLFLRILCMFIMKYNQKLSSPNTLHAFSTTNPPKFMSFLFVFYNPQNIVMSHYSFNALVSLLSFCLADLFLGMSNKGEDSYYYWKQVKPYLEVLIYETEYKLIWHNHL